MPGSTNTAGLSLAGLPSPRARPRTPVADSPAHDSGPIDAKSGGRSCVSALTIASAVRSLREVVEVRDLAAVIEHEGGACRARRAAVHRARLHHEIVVGPVERVGQQCLQPRRDRIALDVAGDDAQIAGNRFVYRVQPPHQRAVGNLRREARNLFGVGAALRDLAEELHELRRDRHAGELQRPLEHRQVGVEPLRGEQRAARRAGDAHDALDFDAARLHFVEKRFQRLALRLVLVAFEERGVLRTRT